MELLDTIMNRRSVRTFTDEQVSEENLRAILEAGLLVPRGKGQRPTSFVVVQDTETLEKLSHARKLGGISLANAKTIIAILGNEAISDTWIEDASISLSFMMLRATDLGVGTCWVQGRGREAESGISTDEYVRSILNYPEEVHLVALLAVGMPDKETKPHSLEEAHFDQVHHGKY